MSDRPDEPEPQEPPGAALDLLTPKEVAALLRVSTKTIERLVWDGRIPAFKINNRTIRFHRSDVVASVRANTRRLSRAERADTR